MRNPLKFIEAKDIRYGIIYKQVLMIFKQFGLFIDQLPYQYKQATSKSPTQTVWRGQNELVSQQG